MVGSVLGKLGYILVMYHNHFKDDKNICHTRHPFYGLKSYIRLNSFRLSHDQLYNVFPMGTYLSPTKGRHTIRSFVFER